MGVIFLHTAYLAVLVTGWLDLRGQMIVALVAYAAYVVNAAQFLWKFRLARQTRPAAAQTLVSNSGVLTRR